jgi:Glycosyltransferase family 87
MSNVLVGLFICLTAILLMTPAVNRWLWGDQADIRHHEVRLLKGFIFLTAAASFMATIAFGSRLDYRHYLNHWQLVRSGESPWGGQSTNTYGPLYNLLAIPAGIDPFLPKLIFTGAWIAASTFLVGLMIRNQLPKSYIWAIAAFLLIGPYFPVCITVYGYFDILPAVLGLAAIHLRLKNREVTSGIVLALSVLLKYYPFALLPFLTLDQQRMRWRVATACMLTIVVGMSLSMLIWGRATFEPLLYGVERESKLLSIFRFLRGSFSPLHLIVQTPNVDFLSLPAMALGYGVALIGCYLTKMRVVSACIVGMLTALLFYKVGHAQFLTIIVLLIPYWYIVGCPELMQNRRLFVALICYLSLLSLFIFLYAASGHLVKPPWIIAREFVSLPFFFLTCWVLVEFFRAASRLQQAGYAEVATEQ